MREKREERNEKKAPPRYGAKGVFAIALLGMLLTAAIFLHVPLASGDDWTFATWFRGFLYIPAQWLEMYCTFNGRPTMHILFSMLHYEKFCVLAIPLCLAGIFWVGRKLFGLRRFVPCLTVLALFYSFSWNMKRNIYLWPVGAIAYWILWAAELVLFACVILLSEQENPKHSKIKICLLAILIFFCNFGTENMALGVALLDGSCLVLKLCTKSRISVFLKAGAAFSLISALMCIFNPANQRFKVTMAAVDVPLWQMAIQNLSTILEYLLVSNWMPFVCAGALLLAADKPGKNSTFLKIAKIIFAILYGIYLLALTALAGVGGISKLFHTAVLGGGTLSILFMCLFLMMMLVNLIAVIWKGEEPQERKEVHTALLICAMGSAGVFVVLPEVSERVMFYALSIVILFCGFLAEELFCGKKIQAAAGIIFAGLLLVQYVPLCQTADAAAQVNRERERIIEEYKEQVAEGTVQEGTTLVLPAYEPNSVNWSDCNCNPKKDENPYAYDAFKAYYDIPEDVEVIVQ